MKMKSKLIALAVGGMGIPTMLEAQAPPKKDLTGEWVLTVSVPHVPVPMSAVAICGRYGSLTHFGYQPVPGGIGAGAQLDVVGSGKWKQTGYNTFSIKYLTKIRNKAGEVNGSELVDGTVKVTGDEVTGTAETRFLNENRNLLFRTPATVTGKRVTTPSSLADIR